MENNILPDFISGIPTAKNKSRERRSLIAKYYSNLWKRLQREGHNYRIYNDYLGVDVYILEKESDKKTINAASKNWQSTLAVKHLYDIVINATGDENQPVYVSVKTGTQTYNGYKNMAILYYDFVNIERDYLNFRAKLTIGVKANDKQVQYCVNKIEVKEKKPTVQSNYP